MSAISDQLCTRAAETRRLDAVRVLGWAPIAIAAAIAAWFAWERSRIRTPSLIDDWYAVTYGRAAFEALAHGGYPAALDFSGRFRPAYSGVWSFLQWHLLGAPSVTVAVFWGIARTMLFFVAIWMLARWLAPQTARAWTWLAPLAVVLTPAVAVDLTRFGPGDPTMVWGLVLGIALIMRGWRRAGEATNWPTQLAGVACVAAGYLAYVFGVYAKEASFCLLVLIPFLLPTLRQQFSRYTRGVRLTATVLALLLVAPLVHVASHVVGAAVSNERPYPAAEHSLASRFFTATVSPLLGRPATLGTVLWLFAVPVAVAAVVVAVRRRDRDAWLLAGVLLTGYLMTALALARGEIGSWYYIPWIVAVAPLALRGLARAHRSVLLSVAALLLVAGGLGARDAIAQWRETEMHAADALAIAKGVVDARCALYLVNFDIERRVAIPLLFSSAEGTSIGPCGPGSRTAYALSWKSAPLPQAFAVACRQGWERQSSRTGFAQLRCARLAAIPEVPDQNRASGTPEVKVVRVVVPRERPPANRLFQSR